MAATASVEDEPTTQQSPPVTGRGSGLIEARSIDYVPRRERHGRVWHQGPFWFTGNFVLPTMITGFVGPALGLSVGWAVLAAVLGVCFGTFFMAFHANQGPRMGLPQMIQSRAQFGLRGAIFPFIAVVFVYVGFSVFNVILVTDGLTLVLPGDKYVWYPLIVVAALALAVVGYDVLHFVQRWMTYLLVALFTVLTVAALVHLDPGAATPDAGFSGTAFLAQFGVAAGYQISYAVYVSDYSRYLPADAPARSLIGWTYAGAALSAAWLMALGALIAGALPEPDAIISIRTIGNSVFDGFGTFAVLAVLPSLVTIMAVNCYGAMLTSASAVDAFRPVRATIRARVVGLAIIALLVCLIALLMPEDYLGNFNTFLLLMLYFLVPWTAVNLVDFYFVRRGHYAITEIFNPRGIYGLWSARGLISYFAGFAAMVPFMATSFYTGPVADTLGGADISFAIGLIVAGGVYKLLGRGVDVGREAAAIEESERLLEG